MDESTFFPESYSNIIQNPKSGAKVRNNSQQDISSTQYTAFPSQILDEDPHGLDLSVVEEKPDKAGGDPKLNDEETDSKKLLGEISKTKFQSLLLKRDKLKNSRKEAEKNFISPVDDLSLNEQESKDFDRMIDSLTYIKKEEREEIKQYKNQNDILDETSYILEKNYLIKKIDRKPHVKKSLVYRFIFKHLLHDDAMIWNKIIREKMPWNEDIHQKIQWMNKYRIEVIQINPKNESNENFFAIVQNHPQEKTIFIIRSAA